MTRDADLAEFEAFARSVRGWLRREAHWMCGDWHEADDIVQIALCNVYRSWDRLDRRAALGAYARRVVVRSFLSERRRLHRRHEVTALVADDAAHTVGPHAAVEARATLLPALRRLGSRQRAILALRFLRGLSVEETAQALGCAAGTVTSQTTRALAVLRRDLEI